MQVIELMACTSCGRVVDQFTYPVNCPRCGGKWHKAVSPTIYTLVKWFLTHPIHVTELIIEDLMEKYAKRS